MKDFFSVIQSRKSVRSFTDAPVSREIIEKIITIGVHAPTNCNQQLWNVIVIEDLETKKRLVKEAASNTLIQRAPVVMAITYDGWNYKEAIQGASLMIGHMLLAAEYYGLGSLPMNSYGADSKTKIILNIPNSNIICCFVLLGYPDEQSDLARPITRRPISEIIHYGKFQPKDTPPFTYNPNDWSIAHIKSHQEYYARKTKTGKEMDIMNKEERALVHDKLQNLKGPIIDILSYDGAYLREFPNVPITTIDFTPEAVEYTKAAALQVVPDAQKRFTHEVYNESDKRLTNSSYASATMIFKLERISEQIRQQLFKQTYATLQPEGEFILIARMKNPFLSLFFWLIRLLFGNDVRKTGIFAFFGPYAPISPQTVIKDLHRAGFQEIKWEGFFLFPAFYERIYQMMLQYRASEGSSYIHRNERNTPLARLIDVIISIQRHLHVGIFGSVIVIRCTKDPKASLKS